MFAEIRYWLLTLTYSLMALEIYASLKNPFLFPQLEERVIWILIPVAAITAFFYLPWMTERFVKKEPVYTQDQVFHRTFTLLIFVYLILAILSKLFSWVGDLRFLLYFLLIIGIFSVLQSTNHSRPKGDRRATKT